MKKTSLPILNTISYSALTTHKTCGWFFRKKYIERISINDSTIWTSYGTLVHTYLQAVIQDKMSEEEAAKKFIRSWFTYCKIYKKEVAAAYTKGDPKKLCSGPVKAIMTIKDALRKEFGTYELIAVEFRLQANTKYPQVFKGFIDLVLKLEDDKIIIADLKTTDTHYTFKKYQDKYREYQLTLYKHYFCLETETDPQYVETYFITIPKNPKEKTPIEFTRVSSGSKKIENALKWLHGVLNSVKGQIYIKNRTSCEHFYGKDCPLYRTKHCS